MSETSSQTAKQFTYGVGSHFWCVGERKEVVILREACVVMSLRCSPVEFCDRGRTDGAKIYVACLSSSDWRVSLWRSTHHQHHIRLSVDHKRRFVCQDMTLASST